MTHVGNCIQMAAALICCPLLLQRVSLKQTPISCMLLASVAADPQTRDPLSPEVKIWFFLKKGRRYCVCNDMGALDHTH